MGAVVGNVYYNTESGLAPTIDRLTGLLDQDAQQRDRLAGITPALTGMGIPVSQPQSFLSRMLGSVGLDNTASQPRAAAAPAAAPPQTAAPAPVFLPAFAAGGGGISPNVQQALAYFQDKGLSPVAAQGLVGNFMRESGGRLDPNAMNPNGGATGIAQWLGDRARGLQQFASAAGRPVNDLRTQLDYAWSELSGPEKATLAALQKAQNPLQATVAGIGFERPEGWSADNPLGAKDFSKRLAATVGIGGMPASATAYAPQGGVASTPASQAIDKVAPGTNAAGAEVAAAGLRARTAAGYGPPPGAPTGVSTGAQAAAATGAAPMPLATSEPHIGPSVQPGSTDPATSRPTLQTNDGAPIPGGITKQALGAMLSNPASFDIGLKIWQQMLGKADFGFVTTPGGDVLQTNPRTGQAQLVYKAPLKREHVELNGRALSFDPQSGSYTDATPAGLPQGYRPATPQEQQAWHVPDGTPLFVGPTGKPETFAGGTNVTLNNAIDPIQKAAGDRFDRSLQAADAAARTIPNIRVARQQLQSGIFAGALSGETLGLQKLAGALGFPVDTNKITNTESFNGAIGPIVLETVKGLGAGSGISNADRDFAERMVGSKTLDAPSIARLLDIRERAALATIQQHKLLVDQIQASPAGAAAYKNIGPAMSVAAPPPAAEASQPVRVSSPNEAMRLPPGTMFIDPNGTPRMRP